MENGMDKLEVIQNGAFADGTPVFQIGTKEENGSYTIVNTELMGEEEAKAQLEELQPTKKATKKK